MISCAMISPVALRLVASRSPVAVTIDQPRDRRRTRSRRRRGGAGLLVDGSVIASVEFAAVWADQVEVERFPELHLRPFPLDVTEHEQHGRVEQQIAENGGGADANAAGRHSPILCPSNPSSSGSIGLDSPFCRPKPER